MKNIKIFELSEKEKERFLKGFGVEDTNPQDSFNKMKKEADSILKSIKLKETLDKTASPSERMKLMSKDEGFRNFLKRTGLEELFEKDLKETENEEKGLNLKETFPQESLVSTRAFESMMEAFEIVPSSISKSKNIKEFKKNLLKMERNNFNRLIDKELSKMEKGE